MTGQLSIPLPEFGPEQFRMCGLQVFNWGTFSGVHDVPIAERGFLFVGRSGAGKTTLLDAFSALLVPPKWVDFNAAAREGERSGRDRYDRKQTDECRHLTEGFHAEQTAHNQRENVVEYVDHE